LKQVQNPPFTSSKFEGSSKTTGGSLFVIKGTLKQLTFTQTQKLALPVVPKGVA